MSGVTVTEECLELWEQLKQRKLKCCNFILHGENSENLVPHVVIGPDAPTPFEDWKGSLGNRCMYSISEVENNNYNHRD